MTTSTLSWIKKAFRVLLAAAFWAAVWQMIAMLVDLPLLLPGPLDVLGTLGQLVREGPFWGLVGLTLGRILLGFLAGACVGFLLAVGTCFVPLLDVIFSPAIRVLRAAPVTSFILLCMLWIRSGLVPAFIASLMTIPIVWENVTMGFRNTDPKLLEMGKVFRMGRGKRFFLIYLPSAMGYFRAALLTSMGMAFKSGVAAEVLCQPKLSVGTQLYYSKIYLETEKLFAWTAVVVCLSVVMENLLKYILRENKR